MLQSRQTVSRCIASRAQQYREQLTELSKEPIKSQSLAVSPDMRTD